MGTGGFRVGIVSKVFDRLNICLSMSKYPLRSNLGGDWGLGWGLGV